MASQLSKSLKPKFSVAIATFNEEGNIGPCLESVRQLADEIIIVDGSSTDRTVEIARKYGAEVIVTTNKPIFHINKQMAVDQCRGEWILQLDADERMTASLHDEIKNKILNIKNTNQKSKNNQEVVAYYIPRKNYFLGRWLRKGGQYPDYVIRFFKRGKAYLPCQSVHEQMQVRGKVGYLKGHLLHYTAPAFSRYLINANRYTSLTAKEMITQKVPISLLTMLKYFCLKPFTVFLSLYLRHKGFLDGFPGFVFACFSGLHYAIAYVKYWELKKQKRGIDFSKDWL